MNEELNNQNITVSFDTIKINILHSKEIEAKLTNLVETPKSNLILDFSNVKFIDSTGFMMLFAVKKLAIMNNSTIEYINISSELQELFDLMNFDSNIIN